MKRITSFVVCVLATHLLYSQSEYRTSDRELYEYRLKKYEDSVTMWMSSKGFVWPDKTFKKVTKDFFLSKYNKDYNKKFVDLGIEPIEFYYKERMAMKGSCICEGFENKKYFVGIYKKPTQKVTFIEPEVNQIIHKHSIPNKTKATYIRMGIKIPPPIQADTDIGEFLSLREHPNTTHLHNKELFFSFTGSGYLTYDRHQKRWIEIEDGYWCKWKPKTY